VRARLALQALLGALLAGCTTFVSLGSSGSIDGGTADGEAASGDGSEPSSEPAADVNVPEAGATDGASPCDPLAPLPLALGVILGVGRDSSGVVYVADTGSSGEPRVFVSNGMTLGRQRVVGSDQSGTTQYRMTFESAYGSGSDARDLLVNVQDGQPSGMALAPPNSTEYLADAGSDTTPLTPDLSAIEGMTVVSLPATVAYLGDVSNGDVLIVTVPTDSDLGNDYRFFYGPDDDLSECTGGAFGSEAWEIGAVFNCVGDGGFEPFSMDVPIYANPDGGAPEPPAAGTLTLGAGPTFGLTLRWPTPTSLAGYTFTGCLGYPPASVASGVVAPPPVGDVAPCPLGYAHPSVCCQAATDLPTVCSEASNPPFQACRSPAITFPDPSTCCSLDTDSTCALPDGDAAMQTGDAGPSPSCYFQCGPGGYIPGQGPWDSGSGPPACASVANPIGDAAVSADPCVWCCSYGGCPTNQVSCPSQGCGSFVQAGIQCDPCPAGWQTPTGGQYDLCCRTNSQGGTDCFSQATSIQ
jgi:hypothetical protein